MRRRTVVAGLGAGLLSGCAPDVVGRGPSDPIEGGIGGTGIVGLITDEARLLVNGRPLEVTPRTRLEAPVRLGQAVEVEAQVRDGAVVASRLRDASPLVGRLVAGPVGLSVNGVAVRPEPDAIRGAAPGARVAVSGLWRGDAVVAARLDPATAGPDILAGVIEDGAVGGTPVRPPRWGRLPPSGTFARLAGRYEGGAFVAAEIERGRFPGLGGSLRRLSVEGYLEPRARAPGYALSGLGHSFDRGARLGPLAGTRAVIEGPYRGTFRASLGLPLPEGLARRRAVLADRPSVRALDLRRG